MRGLSKPWPPADVSPDCQEPCTFVEAEKQFLDALSASEDKVAFARSQYEDLDNPKLREVMYREQGSICAYCERRIEEGHPAPRIDHWRPLSKNPDLALHWKNLYLSCATPETCDTAKGHRELRWDPGDAVLPWPVDLRYENVVGFNSLGEMYVRSDANLDPATRKALQLAIEDQRDGAAVRKSIFNLNHPALVAAREAALHSERSTLEKAYPNKHAPTEDRVQRSLVLLGRDPLPQFVSIRVGWLRRTLGRGC